MRAFFPVSLLGGLLAAASACNVVQLAQVQDSGMGADSPVGCMGPAPGCASATCQDGGWVCGQTGCAPPGCDAGATDSGGADSGAAADVAETSTGPLAHSVVLFGGDGPTFFTDTWEWDGASWLERNVSGPPPRYDHAMAGLNGKAILFGGQGESGTLGDTWQWDGTSWTQLNIPGPTPRFGHRMTTVGNKIVLFGGASWTSTGAMLTTGLHCVGHSIAALNGIVYLFGGVGAVSDTWAYHAAAWTQVASTGPVGRAWAAMATAQWSPPSIILFGGQVNANDILSDTWQWDGTTWKQLVATGLPNQPPPRWDPGIAMFQGLPGQQGLVLFGGAQGIPPGGWLGDTWVFSVAGAWAQANVSSPPARQVYTAAGR
jgi:hypothetical protein